MWQQIENSFQFSEWVNKELHQRITLVKDTKPLIWHVIRYNDMDKQVDTLYIANDFSEALSFVMKLINDVD